MIFFYWPLSDLSNDLAYLVGLLLGRSELLSYFEVPALNPFHRHYYLQKTNIKNRLLYTTIFWNRFVHQLHEITKNNIFRNIFSGTGKHRHGSNKLFSKKKITITKSQKYLALCGLDFLSIFKKKLLRNTLFISL